MKTRIAAALVQEPPDWEHARDLLKEALLDAGCLDPLEPEWCFLADDISHAILDLDTQLRFWKQLDYFFARRLPQSFPDVDFSRGHILFRQAILLTKMKDRLKDAKRLLLRAREEDLRRGGESGESAASMWLIIIEDIKDGELGKLSDTQRGYMIDALRYSWNGAALRKASDDRVPGLLARLSSIAPRTRRSLFRELALARYQELLQCAEAGLVVPALACTAYLAEWIGVIILRKQRVTRVTQGRRRVLPEEAYLSTLVKEVKARDRSENSVVGNLLATVQGIRNRIHAGNDIHRSVALEPILARVFPHLTDRLVVQTDGWLLKSQRSSSK